MSEQYMREENWRTDQWRCSECDGLNSITFDHVCRHCERRREHAARAALTP